MASAAGDTVDRFTVDVLRNGTQSSARISKTQRLRGFGLRLVRPVRWLIDNPYREWGRYRVERVAGNRFAPSPVSRETVLTIETRASGDSSYEGHVVDALAARGDEGRRSLR